MSTTVKLPVELSSGLMEKARELCKGKRINPEELLHAFEQALPYFENGGRAGDRLSFYDPIKKKPEGWVVKVGHTNSAGRFVNGKSAIVLTCTTGARARKFAGVLNVLYGHYKQLWVAATAQKYGVNPAALGEAYEYIRSRGLALSQVHVVENPEYYYEGFMVYNVVGLAQSERLLIWGVSTKERAEAYCAALRELCRIS